MKKLIFIFLLLLLPLASSHAALAKPTKVLIVPGHDDKSFGAQFQSVKEADMTVKLGLMLYDQLAQDHNFEVYITRDWDGYKTEFREYLINNEEKIARFIKESKDQFNHQIKTGAVEEYQNVGHNEAEEYTALKLYGINKWANENGMDAVIHLHFNDYPRWPSWERGDYKGFAVFVPHEGLKNAKESSSLGFFIFNSLEKNYYVSNYKREASGVVPDQELIALGANNTLNTRSVLIEYGYIYEKIFSTFYKREAQMKRMASRTYEGLKKYFNYIARS